MDQEKKSPFGGQKGENKQSPKTGFGLQNKYGRVIHVSIVRKFLMDQEENLLLGVKNVKKSPESPKTEFGLQNQFSRVIYPTIGNFIWSKKNIL
jgi:hypothetical protein